METVRQSLHAKLDAFLDNIASNGGNLDATHLTIEALVFVQDAPTRAGPLPSPSERSVLATIDLRALPTPISPPTSQTAEIDSHLPSPGTGGLGHGGPSITEPEPDAATPQRPGCGRGDRDQPSGTESHNLRRKAVGGLRLGHINTDDSITTPPRTPSPPTVRQLETDDRQFPKRRKVNKDGPAKLEQSTVNKLIEGIWEQIHRPANLALGPDLYELMEGVTQRLKEPAHMAGPAVNFETASISCQQVTSGSRTARALEVIVQAHWVDCYDERIKSLQESRPDLKTCEVKKMVMTEACTFFKWSEKDLRNRMGIWKGYREIKDAAGWAALIFAGLGIYRFCKYRLGFDPEALAKLQSLRSRFEVVADTLRPQWRQLLSLVGGCTQLHWRGHPHDWVVSKRQDPVPLAFTYRQTDPRFTFTHLDESIIDTSAWGDHHDPRRSSDGPIYTCNTCSTRQSTTAEENECECFPDLFGPNPPTPKPVQIFRTDNGCNNGLLACCTFPRGLAVGEFVGLITKGLANVDVMQSHVSRADGSPGEPYQIWQGRQGNYTRFINHSCQPNCQFQPFTWLGVQRIVVVSKGVAAGKEITVDYSPRYWQHLDKACLCGGVKCRYANPERVKPNDTARLHVGTIGTGRPNGVQASA